MPIMTFEKFMCVGLLVIGVSSCYDPHGENFVYVEPLETPAIDINLANQSQPVYIYQKTNLGYNIDDNGHSLIEISGSLDGVSLTRENQPTFIILDPGLFQNGNHVLQIEATFLTGSGSLADKLGQETFTITKEFDVVIDLVPPAPARITSFEVKEGSFYINWSVPEKENFLKYRVKRLSYYQGNYYDIWSPNPVYVGKGSLQFRDSTYLGSEVFYQVDLVGYNFTVSGAVADTTVTPFDVRSSVISDSSLNISWPQPELYKNMKSVTARLNGITLSTYEPVAVSFEKVFGFGAIGYLELIMQPINNTGGSIFLAPFMMGEKIVFTGLDKTIQATPTSFNGKKIIVRREERKVYEVEETSYSIIAEHDFTSYVNQGDTELRRSQFQFGYTALGDYFCLFVGNLLFKFDVDFNLVDTLDINSVVGFNGFGYNIVVSNNNLAGFITFPGNVGLIDLETGAVLLSLSYAAYIDLSKDGKYFSYNNSIYEINSNVASLHATLTYPSLKSIQFNPYQSNEAWLTYFTNTVTANQVQLYQVDLGTITAAFDKGTLPRNITYDPVFGYYGCNGSGYYYLFDFNTNTILRKIKLINDYSGYQLRDNALFADAGYKFLL